MTADALMKLLFLDACMAIAII